MGRKVATLKIMNSTCINFFSSHKAARHISQKKNIQTCTYINIISVQRCNESFNIQSILLTLPICHTVNNYLGGFWKLNNLFLKTETEIYMFKTRKSEQIRWAVPESSRLLKQLYDEKRMEVLAKQGTPKYSEVLHSSKSTKYCELEHMQSNYFPFYLNTHSKYKICTWDTR